MKSPTICMLVAAAALSLAASGLQAAEYSQRLASAPVSASASPKVDSADSGVMRAVPARDRA